MSLKERFISNIEALRDQLDYDISRVNALSKLDIQISPYDNSKLVNALIRESSSYFKDFKSASDEIYSFIYELNFGRIPNSPIKNVFNLYMKLYLKDSTTNN